MRGIFEIIAAMLAAFGLWTLLHSLCDLMLYPRALRRRVNAAVFINNETSDLPEIAAYVKTLGKEGKISPERLIIVAESDIINGAELEGSGFRVIVPREEKDAGE